MFTDEELELIYSAIIEYQDYETDLELCDSILSKINQQSTNESSTK